MNTISAIERPAEIPRDEERKIGVERSGQGMRLNFQAKLSIGSSHPVP